MLGTLLREQNDSVSVEMICTSAKVISFRKKRQIVIYAICWEGKKLFVLEIQKNKKKGKGDGVGRGSLEDDSFLQV